MYCSRGIDPVFEAARLKAERLRERQEENKDARTKQFQFKSMEEVGRLLTEAGENITVQVMRIVMMMMWRMRK